METIIENHTDKNIKLWNSNPMISPQHNSGAQFQMTQLQCNITPASKSQALCRRGVRKSVRIKGVGILLENGVS